MRGARARVHTAAGWLAVLATLSTVVGCSSPGTGVGSGQDAGPALINAPLGTSFPTSTGLVAIVAMGRLSDPLNTFWQLFVRPDATARWTLATPPAVADNGGLVASPVPGSGAGTSLLAGFEPSQYLHFSPLALTDDDGGSWAPGLVPGALAVAPDALASSSSRSLALLRAGGGEVVRSAGDPSVWSKVVSRAALASSAAGTSCGVGQFTAVALGASGREFVGSTCARPGVVGIFGAAGAGWRLVGPRLRGRASTSSTQVVRLVEGGGVVSGLVAARTGSTTDLIGVTDVARGTWNSSTPLLLDGRDRLVSTGVESGGGFVVLASRPNGSLVLESETRPGGGWLSLPAPPAGTATVAMGAGGVVAALTVHSTLLTDWRLDAATGTWSKIGTVTVPIAFGSSQ